MYGPYKRSKLKQPLAATLPRLAAEPDPTKRVEMVYYGPAKDNWNSVPEA